MAARATDALGTGEKRCEPAEAPNRVPSRRALYARRGLPVGTVVAEADLIALRPGDGIPANRIDDVVGCRVISDVPAGAAIRSTQIVSAVERRTA